MFLEEEEGREGPRQRWGARKLPLSVLILPGLWSVTVPPERPVPQQSALATGRVDLPRHIRQGS